MALAATYVPARRAARRAPLEDLLSKGRGHTDTIRRWPGYLGLVSLAAILALLLSMVHGWLNAVLFEPLIAPAMAAYLASCALLIPLVLKPLTRLAGLILKPLLGAEGSLAVRQMVRHQTRTALTVGVLMIVVIFAIGFGQSLVNGIDHIRDWFRRIIATDFYVRATWPDPTVHISTATIPEALADQMASLDYVDHVDKFSFIPARAARPDQPTEWRRIVILAATSSSARPAQLALVEGEPEKVQQAFFQGEVILGTALAQRLGTHAGDTILLESRQGALPIRVAGTASEYTGGGLALYMDWNTAKKLFDVQGVHALMVSAQPGKVADLANTLKTFCDERSLLLQSNAEVRDTLDRQMAGLLGLIWVLLSLVFVVASLGIVNTLTMNVLEQTRELGVLRAIGMRRVQVAKLVLAQALALVLISLPPGALAGVGLAYLINLSTYPLTGQPVPFHLDLIQIAGCFAAALAITILAALLPARRAVRLRVIQALQYE